MVVIYQIGEMNMQKRKRYKDMSEKERMEHDNKVIDRNYTIALYLNLLNLFILFIANLDKIVSFGRYVLSCLH